MGEKRGPEGKSWPQTTRELEPELDSPEAVALERRPAAHAAPPSPILVAGRCASAVCSFSAACSRGPLSPRLPQTAELQPPCSFARPHLLQAAFALSTLIFPSS